MSSMQGSIPDPGVGAVLKPDDADREFMVVLFLLPGELVDVSEPGPAPMFSETLNWLESTCASDVDDSIDQCDSRPDTKLDAEQLNKGFTSSFVGLLLFNRKEQTNKNFKKSI